MSSMDSLLLTLAIILLITSSFLVSPIVSITSSSSCNKTPYPQVCNHYITNTLSSTLDVDFLDDHQGFAFRDLALKVTMDQTLEAHRLVSSSLTLNSKSFYNERAKMAWDDCLELYEDTIDKLNHSLTSNNALDANTWLSASLANQQTCLNGFNDLNIPNSHLEASFPSFYKLSIDLPMLLSNSLALHKESSTSSSTSMHFSKQVRGRRSLLEYDDKFPAWLSASDRKLLQSGSKRGDIVVAQDGSGNYKTISQAIAAAKESATGSKRVVIYVKRGVYKESVEVKKTMKKLMFVGDGMDATIVTGNQNSIDGSTTFRSATFGVSGEGDCDIFGTIDFIFGDASAVLQNCNIYVRKPMSNQLNTVTAQSRRDPNENTGIVIHNCRITAAPELKGVQGSVRTYLGRPWQKYSRVVIMKSNIDGLVASQGWFPWSGSFGLDTLYYGEYMNTGAGAATGGRVKWPGFRVITSTAEAGKFTVGNFLAGDAWIPGTGVPFAAGL